MHCSNTLRNLLPLQKIIQSEFQSGWDGRPLKVILSSPGHGQGLLTSDPFSLALSTSRDGASLPALWQHALGLPLSHFCAYRAQPAPAVPVHPRKPFSLCWAWRSGWPSAGLSFPFRLHSVHCTSPGAFPVILLMQQDYRHVTVPSLTFLLEKQAGLGPDRC